MLSHHILLRLFEYLKAPSDLSRQQGKRYFTDAPPQTKHFMASRAHQDAVYYIRYVIMTYNHVYNYNIIYIIYEEYPFAINKNIYICMHILGTASMV